MKVILRFDTDSQDEEMEMLRCLKATEAFLYIWDILHNSKKSILWKVEANQYETQEDLVEDIYTMMWERLKDRDLNLEKLIV